MNRITLNNNIQMPMLGFGTFLMGGSECEESVLAAIRSGYRMIDTAEAYRNEEAVGSAIVKSGIPREELFLVTKVNFRSYENTRETVEASLNKLKTSYLDLVLLHWPFGNYYAAWRELEKMYHEGKIRAIGVSNFDPGRLIDLIEFNEVVPAVNQIETHLLCQRRAEHEWLEKYHVQHMFYTMITSAINLIRFRRLGSPILSAAKVLHFVAAMMSILGLQTAMIYRFSENGENYRRMMNAITGGFVYCIVILIAIYMLLHGRYLRKKAESVEPI